MSAHYRTPTLTPPVDDSPPLWQRLRFRIDRSEACRRWQWARREAGGRWATVVHSVGGGAFVRLWHPTQHCPLTWDRHTPHNNSAILAMVGNDHNATIDAHRAEVDAEGRCPCEVWP